MKISYHSETLKRTSERVDKLTIEFFNGKRQNLTISFELENICQYLGGGGFSVGSPDPRQETYIPPNRRGDGQSSSAVLETSQQGEVDRFLVARISLDPTMRIMFSERSSDAPASGVGPPANGASNSNFAPTKVDFFEKIKQLIRTEIGGLSVYL